MNGVESATTELKYERVTGKHGARSTIVTNNAGLIRQLSGFLSADYETRAT